VHTVCAVKTLHTAYRVTDLSASLSFYSALGYEEVGRVDVDNGGSLTMLKFPGEEVVTVELVQRPADGPVDVGTGFSHLAIQVDDLTASFQTLRRHEVEPEPSSVPADERGPGRRGSQIPMATGSSWCNGRPGMPTGSPPPTSPDPSGHLDEQRSEQRGDCEPVGDAHARARQCIAGRVGGDGGRRGQRRIDRHA
jgi:lactoylglutathione lyase